jgi:uncharacterized surface protein with fasciclin (FAS1) repeats
MNLRRSRLGVLACAATLTLTVAACADDEPDAAPPATEAPTGGEAGGGGPTTTLGPYVEPMGDIVGEALTQKGEFTAVAGFLVEAGLVQALRGDGPFTVFAPLNAAIEALPADTLDAVYADKDLLTAVLTYHVVPGEYTSDQLTDGLELETLQGQSLTVTVEGDTIFVNGNPLVATDVMATNGVIHAIDGVLVPET